MPDAWKNRVPAGGNPTLVDPHPGDEPGDRKKEDCGEGGGRAHAEGLQAGHEGDGADSKCRDVRHARHRDREPGVGEGQPKSPLPREAGL